MDTPIPPRSTRSPGPIPPERDDKLNAALRRLLRKRRRIDRAGEIDPDTGRRKPGNPLRWRVGLPREF